MAKTDNREAGGRRIRPYLVTLLKEPTPPGKLQHGEISREHAGIPNFTTYPLTPQKKYYRLGVDNNCKKVPGQR